jgi:hypothetical protein
LGEKVVLVLSKRQWKMLGNAKTFVISNISAGNITLCHGQHFARELRFD